jgi:hypothetical protein
VIDFHVAKGARGHARRLGIVGVLHDRDSAALLDRREAGRAVIQAAREDSPITSGPRESAADRNSGSMAGRVKFSFGPSDSSMLWSLRSMCLPGGAT